LDIPERQIFKLAFDLVNTQAMREGSVNFNGFLSHVFLFDRREKLERSQIMQAIGQFDQDDPHIVGHGKQHFSEIHRLRRGSRTEKHFIQLGDTFNQLGHGRPELGFDILDRGRGIFYDIMEEGRANRCRIKAQFLGDNIGNSFRMNEIRLAGCPELIFMAIFSEPIGLFNAREISF